IDLPFEPRNRHTEELDRHILSQLLGRHADCPGVVVLDPVEVIAPRNLFVAPKAQRALVDGTVVGRDSAMDHASPRPALSAGMTAGTEGRDTSKRGRHAPNHLPTRHHASLPDALHR